MGILQRFSDIMSANINSLLSGAEEKNAGKLLEKYLADARANLEELKSETSAIIADEMAAARRVAANNEEIAKYDRYAEQAVLASNDDDARKFLDAKSQLVAKKAELEAAYETAKSNSDKMRQMTRKLMEDIASAEGKMVELRAKLTVAEHKEKMDDLMHKVAGRTDMSGFENMMEAVQKRIDSVDAKVALNEELADKMDIKKLEEKYSEKAAEVSASVEADLAALKVKSCDIAAWRPRHKKYFEVCSCSNLGDAQARRLSIRVKGADGKMYLAHTLNNTCVAPPRMLIAFLENHLQKDGSVTIPKCLQPYMGGKEVLIPKH